MHARIQITPARPLSPIDGGPRLAEILAAHQGFQGLAFCAQPEDPGGALVTLWATAEDAREASNRTRAVTHAPAPAQHTYDEVFEVVSQDIGPAAEESPAAAHMVFFDAPRDAAQQDLDEAVSARIRSLTREVPGLVTSFGLSRPDGSWAVLAFATSRQTLEAAELMAREAATSAGSVPPPDRVMTYRVDGAILPKSLGVTP
jgi:hypothetical protein